MIYECGSGWNGLVDEAVEKIKAIKPDANFLQIKEKLGGLRIYLDHYDDEVNDIIRSAERKANKVCENCGSEVRVFLRKNGWLRTLCDDCYSNMGK